jgi:hypothetical protein
VIKLVAIGLAACALVFFLFGRGGEAQAKGCLEKAGASVTQSTFFREILGPESPAKLGDQHILDVRFGEAAAMVAFTDDRSTARELAQFLTLAGPYAPEVVEKVVVVWTDEPSRESAAAVRDCVG